MIGVIDRPPAKIRTIGVALLGCGVVGKRIAQVLVHEASNIARRTGMQLRLKRVLVRDAHRDRGIDRRLVTNRFEDVLDEDIDIAIEVMGGIDPAAGYVRHLLERGVHVITANKTLVAHHGHELCALAAECGATLSFEASVCAAIPVLASLRRLRGDRIRSITGIVNGACNYILTRMSQDDLPLHRAIEEASRLGLVEPDPSADLSGRDSAEKLCILSAIAGFGRLTPTDIATCGIEHVTRDDILFAKRLGCAIKLVASVNEVENGIAASVCPALVHKSHSLASVQLENNALLIDSDLGGQLLLQGKGAGPRPTASALLGDLIESTQRQQGPCDRHALLEDPPASICPPAGAFYVRLIPNEHHARPQSVLEALKAHGVSIDQIEFGAGKHVTLLTRQATLPQIQTAIQSIQGANHQAFVATRMKEQLTEGI